MPAEEKVGGGFYPDRIVKDGLPATVVVLCGKMGKVLHKAAGGPLSVSRFGLPGWLPCSQLLCVLVLYFRHRKSDTMVGWFVSGSEFPMALVTDSRAELLHAFGDRLRQRLEPGRGERPGRPSDPTWTVQRKLSMSEQTLQTLASAADAVSTDERRVSPMQIAALLIEDATQGLAKQLKEN